MSLELLPTAQVDGFDVKHDPSPRKGIVQFERDPGCDCRPAATEASLVVCDVDGAPGPQAYDSRGDNDLADRRNPIPQT